MSDDLNKATVCSAIIIADQGLIIKKCNQKIDSQESRIKELEQREKILIGYYEKIENCAVRVIDADDVFTKDRCISCLSKVINETRETLKQLGEK